MNEEENFVDDEYITDENDPCKVEKITQEDYTIFEEKEEIIDHEKIIQSVQTQSDASFYKNDKIMEDKVLDSLKKGLIK